MAFLLRVLSGKRLETRQDVIQLREEFYRRKEEILHELHQNEEVQSFVEMIYDGNHRETQYFLRSPSQSWLNENPQLVLETVSVLSSLTELSFFKRLSETIEKYGVEPVSDIILELFSQLPFARHIGISDSFLDELKYGWQLGSPLAGKLRSNRHQKQQLRSTKDRLSIRECDETNKLDHCMDGDLPVSTSQRHDNDGVNGCDFREKFPANQAEGSGSDKQVVVEKESVGEQEREAANQTMRVTTAVDRGAGQTASESVSKSPRADFRTPSAISSRGHSSRHSAASELYTTDSDDDSFSTSSHRSLLVAVSETHESTSGPSSSSSSSSGDDSASESDKNEIGTLRDPEARNLEKSGLGHDCLEATKPEKSGIDAFGPEIQHEPDEILEDKLPICSSVVLSSKGSENDLSFYTPEMWTYSEKEAMDMEVGNASDRNIITLEQACSDQEEIMEEVKVVIAPSVEDKYVSVSVQPITVDLWEKGLDDKGVDGTSDADVDAEATCDKNQVHGNLTEKKPSSDWIEKTKSKETGKSGDIPSSEHPAKRIKLEETGNTGDMASSEKEEKLLALDPAEKMKLEETGNSSDMPSSEVDEKLLALTPAERAKLEDAGNSDDMPPSEISEKRNEDEEKVSGIAADKNLAVVDSDRYLKADDKQVNHLQEKVDAADESQTNESQAAETKNDDEGNGNKESQMVEPKIDIGDDEEIGNAESQVVEVELKINTRDGGENGNAESQVVELKINTRDGEENGNVDSQVVEPKINTGDDGNAELLVVDPKDNPRVDEENGQCEAQVIRTGKFSENPVEISETQADKKNPHSQDVKGGELSTEECESAETKPKEEDAIGLERSSLKASDSPPKLEPLVIPRSGLLPLSGPISYSPHSGTVPYSGSLSWRSDSSTNSTRSFAFPILSGEWNSSPVKMAPPERSFSYHRRRSWRSLCCFCSTDPTNRYG